MINNKVFVAIAALTLFLFFVIIPFLNLYNPLTAFFTLGFDFSENPIDEDIVGEDIFDEKNSKILGYCPTMKEEAFLIAEGFDSRTKIVEFQSASEVFNALENNVIDFGVVGRRAKSFEIGSFVIEEVIESGFTLVQKERTFLQTKDLSGKNIHSHYDVGFFPESTIIAHQSLEDSIKTAFNEKEPALIRWEDFSDEFELLVVMDGFEKNKLFRGVFLYSLKKNV